MLGLLEDSLLVLTLVGVLIMEMSPIFISQLYILKENEEDIGRDYRENREGKRKTKRISF